MVNKRRKRLRMIAKTSQLLRGGDTFGVQDWFGPVWDLG